eukprot:1320974-Amphidinium_carterae.3
MHLFAPQVPAEVRPRSPTAKQESHEHDRAYAATNGKGQPPKIAASDSISSPDPGWGQTQSAHDGQCCKGPLGQVECYEPLPHQCFSPKVVERGCEVGQHRRTTIRRPPPHQFAKCSRGIWRKW